MMTRLGFACAVAMNAPELQSAKVVPSDYKYPHASTSLPSKPRFRSICLWNYLAVISERSPDGESNPMPHSF